MWKNEISNYIGGKPASLIDIKGWLIYFNLVMDIIILDSKKRSYKTSIYGETGLSTFESITIQIEDKRYLKHRGIDYFAILRIIKKLATRNKIGGVSTIEQQYIRTVINRKERTMSRKIHELILARIICYRLEKKTILRAYLSSAYYGYKLNDCDSASKLLYSIPASETEGAKAAFLASLLVYPLPKKVIEAARENEDFPIRDINIFLEKNLTIAPWWSERIRKRTSYALYSHKPSNLESK